jgi:hypothetical protein
MHAAGCLGILKGMHVLCQGGEGDVHGTKSDSVIPTPLLSGQSSWRPSTASNSTFDRYIAHSTLIDLRPDKMGRNGFLGSFQGFDAFGKVRRGVGVRGGRLTG